MIARILSIALILTGIYSSNAQNNILRGIVKVQSSGSQPLEGVEVSAFGSNTVYSNSSGMFQMEFRGKSPGSSVSLLVSKQGYELINDKEIERCVIRNNPDDLVFIIMAKQGERNRQALNYYNIIISNSQNTFQKELNSLKSQLAELNKNDGERNVLLEQIANLQEENERLYEQAEALSQQLASIDLDMASDLARDALEQLNQGNIQEALQILDAEVLANNLNESRKEKERLSENLKKAEDAFQQSIENYMIKARLLISSGDFQAAESIYVLAYNADSSQVHRILEIADFYSDISQQDKAIRYYKKAFTLSSDKKQKIEILLDQSSEYSLNGQFDVAISLIENAQSLADTFNENEKTSYIFTLAEIDYNRAIINSSLRKNDVTLQQLDEMKVKYKDFDEREDVYVSLINSVRLNEAIIKIAISELDGVDTLLISYIEAYKTISEQFPKKYTSGLSDGHEILGSYYQKIGDNEKAESNYLKATEILKPLLNSNPYEYGSMLADLYSNFGAFLSDIGENERAREYHYLALDIFNALVEENPIRYKYPLSRVHNNIGVLLERQGFTEDAERQFENVVAVRKDLVAYNPQRYRFDLGFVYPNLLSSKEKLLRKSLDLKYQDEAFEILKDLEEIWSEMDSTTRRAEYLKGALDHFTLVFSEFGSDEFFIRDYINKSNESYRMISPDLDTESKIKRLNSIIDTLSNALIKFPGCRTLLDQQCVYYGKLAWESILDNRLSNAEMIVRNGLKSNPSHNSLKSYLPVILTLQGKKEDAIKIYMEMKDMMDSGKPFKDTFLDDLDSLEAEGITHPDFAEIRKLLNQ